MNDTMLAAQLKESLEDKKELAKQVRSLELQLDARVGQMEKRDKIIKDLETGVDGALAERNNWKTKFDVCKQILDDLHNKLTGGTLYVKNIRQDD